MSCFHLFLSFGLVDVIDILLVAIILYLIYNLIKGTTAINIFIGLGFIYLVWIVIKAFELKLLSSILGKFINVGVIAIVVVFQQEIRKFLLYLGSKEFLKNKSWKNLLRFQTNTTALRLDTEQIALACHNMSQSLTGALIIVARRSDLKFYINSGEQVDAALSGRMLENIFYKNSPMHDGAVIVKDNRLIAARCVLPVTEKEDFPAHYGMRHRAAVGVTELSDALAITVSEQTGRISLTVHGEITTNLTKEKLIILLDKYMKELID
jgi:diadenylate cyclase